MLAVPQGSSVVTTSSLLLVEGWLGSSSSFNLTMRDTRDDEAEAGSGRVVARTQKTEVATGRKAERGARRYGRVGNTWRASKNGTYAFCRLLAFVFVFDVDVFCSQCTLISTYQFHQSPFLKNLNRRRKAKENRPPNLLRMSLPFSRQDNLPNWRLVLICLCIVRATLDWCNILLTLCVSRIFRDRVQSDCTEKSRSQDSRQHTWSVTGTAA